MPKKQTVKSRKSRAGNSAKTARGKPFEKGNVHAFKPGQSGNSRGRPLDTITPHLRAIVQKQYPGLDEITYGEMVAHRLIGLAVSGELGAIREVLDRLEGKPRQALDITENSMDWREAAQAQGVSEEDVVREAQQLINEYLAENGDKNIH
jgi:Family of unknown function (DUF5681)